MANIESINKRINDALPDSHISFPEQTIFLIMKFLDSDTIDLLNTDLENLLNEAKTYFLELIYQVLWFQNLDPLLKYL